MRILYGVVGEGMGHATRSRVVLEHLLSRRHELHVVVSGRAEGFLKDVFSDRSGTGPGTIDITAIHGLKLVLDEVGVDRSASLWANLGAAPEGVLRNIAAYAEVAMELQPELVISDFESWAYLYARTHDVPLVSIDNMQVIHRCRHPEEVTAGRHSRKALDFRIAQLSVKAKVAGADHYLASSFFFPPVRKTRTTLVPPILRPEILAAEREPGDHLLVYQTAANNAALLPLLGKLPVPVRLYGMGTESPVDVPANVTLRPFSQQGFIDDLRTARGAVAPGGYSLMGEAVHLHVPLLAIPLQKQFEQQLNARYLSMLGYGAWAEAPTEEAIVGFLDRIDDHAHGVSRYTPRRNDLLFGCLDELIERAASGERRMDSLAVPSLGDLVSSRTDAALGEDTVR